ncbi:MAG: hypothetical protein BGO70_03720 [Bacteroidetes bacterium 43-93]|nr:MAG: hypothetical protein BGO70_03720 [Bacteroidetes bacterium 43-93]
MNTNSQNSESNQSSNSKKQPVMKNLKKIDNTVANNEKEFYYESRMVNPAKILIHPLLEIAGYDAPDDIFCERANHFKFYERSVVTEDGYAITHPTDILAAQQAGLQEIEVVIMRKAMVNDIIDFISFKHVWKHGKSRRKIYEMATFLTEYVLNKDKEWREQQKSPKTRGIVADTMGISDGKLQTIMQIGNNNPELLDRIDNEEIGSKEALEIIRPVVKPGIDKPFESRKRYANLIISNNPDVSNGEKAKLKIRSIKMDIEEIGLLDVLFTPHATSIYLNGEHFKEVTHNVVSDKGYEGKREYSQHHTLLPNDDSFDIQFILKGLEKFIDNDNIQTKIAA